MAKYTYAKFNTGEQKTRAQSVYQYDYGKILQVEGLTLPTAVEVHFAASKDGEAITRVGTTKDGVMTATIPDSVLENEGVALSYTAYAWIFLTDDTSGYTEYEITIPVQTRAKPTAQGSTEDTDLFREAIEAVNEAAENAVAAKNAASTSAAAAAGSATEAAESAESAKTAAEKAVKEIEDYTSEKKTEITEHTDTEITRADTAMQEASKVLTETIESAKQSNATLSETIDDAKTVGSTITEAVEDAKTAASAANAATEASNKAEADRAIAETARVDAETTRIQNEEQRQTDTSDAITKAKEATEILIKQVNTIALQVNADDNGLDAVILSA